MLVEAEAQLGTLWQQVTIYGGRGGLEHHLVVAQRGRVPQLDGVAVATAGVDARDVGLGTLGRVDAQGVVQVLQLP